MLGGALLLISIKMELDRLRLVDRFAGRSASPGRSRKLNVFAGRRLKYLEAVK